MSTTSERRIAVDLKTASAMCSLSLRTLQSYIRMRRLRALKFGKRTLILVRDLEAFLENGQPSPFAERKANESRPWVAVSYESTLALEN